MIGVRLMFTAWLEICSFISKLSDKKVVLSCVQCFLRPRLSWVVWRSWNYETSRLLFSMYRHVHGRYVWSMFKISFQCAPLRGLLYVCPVFSTTVVWLRDLVIMKFESFGVTVNLHTSLIDALTHARCVNNAWSVNSKFSDSPSRFYSCPEFYATAVWPQGLLVMQFWQVRSFSNVVSYLWKSRSFTKWVEQENWATKFLNSEEQFWSSVDHKNLWIQLKSIWCYSCVRRFECISMWCYNLLKSQAWRFLWLVFHFWCI